MKIKRSYLIALGALIAITLWFAVQGRTTSKENANAPYSGNILAKERPIAKVIISYPPSETRRLSTKLFGQTETSRDVRVKAETRGLITQTPVKEGQYVKAGTLLCRQDIDARDAVISQAKAQLEKAQMDYNAGVKLQERGFRSENQVAALQAALNGAKASLKIAEIERDNVDMRAPFDGIFETQIAEKGDYLMPGQPCGHLVDLDPLLISVELTETQMSNIKQGQTALIHLATGEKITGKVERIGSIANPATRSFTAEISVPNTDRGL